MPAKIPYAYQEAFSLVPTDGSRLAEGFVVDGERNADFDHLREAALTKQQGGGIGYDFSTLRPRGSAVRGVGADASGPLSFMDVWDAMCRTIMSVGARRGAMMATMRCDHPDIEDFVAAKRQVGIPPVGAACLDF